MIISDKYKFVFIHIPKCAGTSIRLKLSKYDEYNGYFACTQYEHYHLGTIDTAHLPLFVLKEYFNKIYEKVKLYNSFTIVRNPFDRFVSSLAQHLSMYGSSPLQRMNERKLTKEVDFVISFLEHVQSDRTMLPYRYIHFQKQIDYIVDNGNLIINNVYFIDNIRDLLKDINKILDFNIDLLDDQTKKLQPKQTVIYRNSLLRLFHVSTLPVTNKIIKFFLSQKNVDNLKRYIYKPRNNKFNKIFESKYVNDFIKYYYTDDIWLINNIISNQ